MKMIWLLILGGWFSLGACLTGFAEDKFLLQVDVLEQDTAAEAESEARRLRGIEVVAVPGRRKECYRLLLSRDEPLKNEVFQMLDPHRPILPLLKEVENQN